MKKTGSKKKIVFLILLCLIIPAVAGVGGVPQGVIDLDHARWSSRLNEELFARFLGFYDNEVDMKAEKE